MSNKRIKLQKFKKALALVLAGVISLGNMVPAYAATGDTLAVKYAGVLYAYDSNGNPAGLNKMGIFKSGNSKFKAVYCGEHSINTPMAEGETKNLPIEKYNKHDDIRKVLFYGYQGPEEWSGFGNSKYNSPYQLFDGNDAKTKTEACGRAVTATALSKAYKNHGGKGHVYDVSGLSAFESYIKNKPAPPSGFEVYRMPSSSGLQDLFTWSYKPEGFAKLLKSSNDSSGITNKFPDNYSLAGAKYKVYTDSNLKNHIATLTTNSEGSSNTIKLDEGKYYVKESEAPKGYKLDTKTHTVNVTSGKTAVLKVSDIPKVTKVNLKKAIERDSKIVKLCPEMYSLKGAKYNVYEYNTKKFMGTLTTDENGNTGSLSVPEGKYFAKETEAPKGFILNSEPTGYVTVKDGNSATIKASDVPGIDPLSIKVTKVAEEGTDKNLPLSGAEYKINYYKGYYKTFSEAEKNKAFRTWVIRTDEKGVAQLRDKWIVKEKSDELIYRDNGKVGGPLGTYTFEEISAPKGFACSGKISIQQARLDNRLQAVEIVKDITDTEKSQTISLTLNKVDKETGKNVPQGFGSLSGAKYEVKYYDSLTGDDKLVGTITTDEAGKGTLTGLKPGLYKIKEVKAPRGYVPNTEEIKVEARIKEMNTANFDYTVKSEETPHKTVISKYYIVNGEKNNLKNAVLQVIDHNGKVMTEFTTNGETKVIKALPDGEYTLHEVSAPEGFVKSEDVKFTVKEGAVENKVEMKDDYTKLDISKRTITGSDELPGAKLEILKDGKVIESWVSGNKPHRINMIPAGKYVLRETVPADGYVTAADINFTVKNTGEVQTVIMKDELTKVDIDKTDIVTGSGVIGAELSVYPVDKDGNILEDKCLDKWITDGNPHRIEGMTIGSYVLREKLEGAGLLGYVTSKDVPFEVTDTMEVQKVEMKDDFTKTEFIKLDSEGEPVEGATLAIVPVNDKGNPLEGETFATWITEKDNPDTDVNEAIKSFDYLPIGKYLLVEKSAPDGFIKSLPVPFEVKDTGDVQSFSMTDKQMTAVKLDKTNGESLVDAILKVVDEEGNTVDRWKTDDKAHYISGLEEGRKYTLIEEKAPSGYATADPVEFTVDDSKENITITMEDDTIKAKILKDNTDGNPVIGAVLELTDEDGNVVRKWTTTEEAEYFEKLSVGTYILNEVETPEGYVKASPVTIEVKDIPEIQEYKMTDKQISATKVEKETGKPLFGAILKVVDEEGNVVDTWETSEKEHFINGLEEGHKYNLIEEEAPAGYATADPLEFKVDDSKEDMVITMKDDIIRVEILKLDKATNKPLSDAVFELIDSNGKVVRKWTSTDKAEVFEKLSTGTYTLKELHAPEGYQKMKDQKLEIKDTAEKQIFREYNELIPVVPKTGDNSNLILWIGIVAGAGIILLRVIKKKTDNLKD